MSTLLDICDLNVGLLQDQNQEFSPGYASIQGKELIFGESARSVFRVQPSKSANQFWRDISTQQISAAFPGVRHQADLVWSHLGSLDRKKLLDIGFVSFPSHYARDQIGLLSGVLQALEIKPSFLCKRSLIMGSQFPEAEYHLDFQLHQLVLTRLIRQNNEITCGEMTEYPGLGLLGCCDALLKGIQTNFIEKTRFDPLYHADTEQQLFNQIVDKLFLKPWSRIDLSVEIQGSVNSIELSENHLETAAKDYLDRIEKILPDAVYVVDNVFSCLPLNKTNQARYMSSNEIFAATEKLKSELDVATEFSELTAIQLNSDDSESYQEPPVLQKEEGQDTDKKPSSPIASETPKPEPKTSNVSDTLLNESTSHILMEGLAVPVVDICLISKNSQLSWIDTKDITASTEVLGKLKASDQGIVLYEATNGLRLNGKTRSGQSILQVEEVISHDKCIGTLIAIGVLK